MERLPNKVLENAISVYETTLDVVGDNDKYENSALDRVTYNFLKELKAYRDAEEQGLLLRLPIAVNDVVDKLFSHNELISLWRVVKEEGITFHKRIWYGMAWDMPKELKQCRFVKIFGTIPESIAHADIINIEVALSAEAEEALDKMKGEEHEIN